MINRMQLLCCLALLAVMVEIKNWRRTNRGREDQAADPSAMPKWWEFWQSQVRFDIV